MTAIHIVQIGCDRCGQNGKTSSRLNATENRAGLQRFGWTTERHGNSLRDYCPTCSKQRAAERAVAS